MLVFRGVYPRSIHSLGSWDWDLQTEVPITSSAKIWRHAVNEMDLSTNIFICIYTVYIYIYISIIGRSHDDLMDISSSLLHQFEWWIIFSLRTCNLPPPPLENQGICLRQIYVARFPDHHQSDLETRLGPFFLQFSHHAGWLERPVSALNFYSRSELESISAKSRPLKNPWGIQGYCTPKK